MNPIITREYNTNITINKAAYLNNKRIIDLFIYLFMA